MRVAPLILACLFLGKLVGTPQAQVLLGEVDAFGTLSDVLGEEEDWVELWNAGDAPVSLQGKFLSDDPDDWAKWPLPAVTLAPDERMVVFASGRDVRLVDHWACPVRDTDLWRYHVPNAELPVDWRLPDYNDAGWSVGPGGFGYGDGDDGTVLEGADVVYLRKTFAVSGLDQWVHGMLAMDYDDGCVAYLNGRELFRSETMEGQSIAFNAGTNGLYEAQLYQGGDAQQVSFDPQAWLVEGDNVLAVQVHNENAGSSDLTIRPFLALASAEPPLAPFNGLPAWWEAEAPGWHTNFKLKPGEPLILSDASGLLDLASVPLEMRAGFTLGRSGAGPGEWCWFGQGTPGAANEVPCLAGVLATPEVSPASGHFATVPTVSASAGTLAGPPGQAQPSVVLRYTTDGSEPTESSPVFTGAWTPSATTVLSVRAFAEGWAPSATVDRTYFITEPATPLERVSILTHPDHLWDWETGIYVLGPNAGEEYPFLGANFWQPWSKESRLEWFGEDGEATAQSRFDLEIHGGWSRAEPQRSFRLDFKPQWTGKLDHAVFPSKSDIAEFGNLNLRNGGQASWENKIQDAFLGELALETKVVASAWRPVEVYLNGEYWGIYGAREKTDENFVEDNFGWNSKGVDLFNQWESQNGSPSAWEATVNPLLALPSGSEAFRLGFEANFDVLSYFDYHILEIHGQNVDWMAAPWGLKNLKYFRSLDGDAKWRPILYDTDACFGAWGTSEWEDYLQLSLYPPTPSSFSALLGKVLGNATLGCGFATRYCDLLSTVFAPARFDARLEQAASWIGPGMGRHIDRWGSPASLDYWQYRVDFLAERNAARVFPSREQVRSHFGFAEPKAVTIEWSGLAGGEVQVNGWSGLGWGWQGAYFGECPIQLAAIPNPGYGFLGWEDNVHTQLGVLDPAVPFATVGLEQEDTFKALFGPCLDGVTVSLVSTSDGLTAVVEGSPQPLGIQWWLGGESVGSGPVWNGPVEPGLLATASNGTCTVFSPAVTEGEETVVSVVEPSATPQLALAVQPNPASGRIQVQGRGHRLTVFQSQGRVHSTREVGSWPVTLDVSAWPAGVYVIRTEGGPTGPESVRLVVE